MTRRRAVLGWLAMGIVSAGCPAEEEAASRPLSVVVDGCLAWSPQGACEYAPGTKLRLWIDTASPVRVAADGVDLTVAATPSDTGQRLSVEVPAGARALALRAGDAGAVQALAPVATATPTDPVRRRARAFFERGRAALRRQRPALAVEHLATSASIAKGRGDLAMARDADMLATFIDVVLRGELAAATARMRASPRPPDLDGRGRILDHYHRGLVAGRLADVRTALRELDAAALWGRRLDSPFWVQPAHEIARVLMSVGRAKDAAAAFDRILERTAEDEACTWAGVAASAGWARIIARPPFELDEARRLLEQAEAKFAGPCPRPADANNIRVNLAFLEAAARAGRGVEEMQVHLSRVEGAEQPEARLWRWALRASAELDRGALAPAAKTYRALRTEARRMSQAPLEWQAEVGLGRVAQAQRRPAAARARFEAAENILDRQGELVPVNRGRRFLLEDRTESLQALVAVDLAAGRRAEAMAAARRARRRTARSLAARDALSLLSPEARLAWSTARARYRAAREKARALAAEAWTAPKSEAGRLAAAQSRAEAEARAALDEALHAVAPGQWFERDATRPVPVADPDTLMVLPFAGPDAKTVHVFFSRGSQVEVVDARLGPAPPEARAALAKGQMRSPRPAPRFEVSEAPRFSHLDWAALLTPRLEGVRQLTLLTDPGAIGPQLGAVKWKGAPLAATLPIVYSLDLSAPPPPEVEPKGALVVYDPRGDLADARVEGEEVLELLAKRMKPVQGLGPLEAKPRAVLDALPGRRLFHFAGHGRYDGPQGWKSALLLVDGVLDMGDLLTLRDPPPTVILTGCETARTRLGRASAGLGLSQVLLAAGSAHVVATRAPVDSRRALEFSRALYRALQDRDDVSLAFVAAVAALEADGQPWEDFVLLARAP